MLGSAAALSGVDQLDAAEIAQLLDVVADLADFLIQLAGNFLRACDPLVEDGQRVGADGMAEGLDASGRSLAHDLSR